MQLRLFESDLVRMLVRMKDRDPSLLKDKQLLDLHKKTHMLYAGNVKRNPVNKKFVNSIVELHNRFVKEMLKRGMKHISPLKKV
jgi:hypothetical protein